MGWRWLPLAIPQFCQCPQLAVHKLASEEITLRFTKFNLVDNLSRISLQVKIETFNGILLCQIKSAATSTCVDSCEVKSW